jgi:hypothetical protein
MQHKYRRPRPFKLMAYSNTAALARAYSIFNLEPFGKRYRLFSIADEGNCRMGRRDNVLLY